LGTITDRAFTIGSTGFDIQIRPLLHHSARRRQCLCLRGLSDSRATSKRKKIIHLKHRLTTNVENLSHHFGNAPFLSSDRHFLFQDSLTGIVTSGDSDSTIDEPVQWPAFKKTNGISPQHFIPATNGGNWSSPYMRYCSFFERQNQSRPAGGGDRFPGQSRCCSHYRQPLYATQPPSGTRQNLEHTQVGMRKLLNPKASEGCYNLRCLCYQQCQSSKALMKSPHLWTRLIP
jgi:hypothetical protein